MAISNKLIYKLRELIGQYRKYSDPNIWDVARLSKS